MPAVNRPTDRTVDRCSDERVITRWQSICSLSIPTKTGDLLKTSRFLNKDKLQRTLSVAYLNSLESYRTFTIISVNPFVNTVLTDVS